MDRAQLHRLAELRLADADALLAAGRWDAAYYLLGYAIECALKACIARQFLEHHVPERRLVESFYSHDIDRLLAISIVKSDLDAHLAQDPNFKINWSIVRNWSSEVRYDTGTSERVAREMRTAVADNASGVLQWLKTRW